MTGILRRYDKLSSPTLDLIRLQCRKKGVECRKKGSGWYEEVQLGHNSKACARPEIALNNRAPAFHRQDHPGQIGVIENIMNSLGNNISTGLNLQG